MTPAVWHGCYGKPWGRLLVHEAYSHPGRYSRALIQKIYEHLKEQGTLLPGDSVLDLFGGVGTGAMPAIALGFHWVGVELNPEYVRLANQNFALWQRLGPQRGSARIVQGDSCEDNGLRAGSFKAAIASPPYGQTLTNAGEGPGARWDSKHHRPGNSRKISSRRDYGRDPANLANLSTRRGRRGEPSAFERSALAIIRQTHRLLRDDGIAVWVTKDYVRRGKRVPFSDNWEALCAAAGFRCVGRVQATFVDNRADQLDLFGGRHNRDRQHKSHWRRAMEEQGAPAIDWEDVRFFLKVCAPYPSNLPLDDSATDDYN